MVDKLNAWSHNWMLALNYDKTKVVHRANSSPTQREFVIGDNFIDKDCYYRYLGFEFCDTLGHNHGVIALNRAAIKALGSFTSKYFALGGTSYDVYKIIYDSWVCPVMDYACEIWGVKSYSFVNTIHKEQCAHTLVWARQCPFPQYTVICHGLPQIWGIAQQPYVIGIVLPECLSHGSHRGSSTGTMNTPAEASKWTQLESMQRRMDRAPMSRLRVYNELDTPTTTPASYVTTRLSWKQRSLLAKLRIGTLSLVLETGRYTQTPVNQRLCRSCNADAIETAYSSVIDVMISEPDS